jgi:hypothetical protein
MTTASASPRPRAVAGTKKTNIAKFLVRCLAVYNGLSENSSELPSPTVTVAAFLVLIQALQTAEENVKTVGAKARNAKRDKLWTTLGTLRIFVQGLADALPQADAAALILLSGFALAKEGVRAKPILEAKPSTIAGVVLLIANATLLVGKNNHKKVTYFWQWSGDNGKTWNDLESTGYAHTQIPNLAANADYQFRVRVKIGDVMGAWADATHLYLHY